MFTLISDLQDLVDLHTHAQDVVNRAVDELKRMSTLRQSHNQWIEKTEWVQDTVKAGELGRHRADVLKKRIEDLTAEVERLKQGSCKGIPRTGCNYLADCDRVCNKCGQVHHHHQMVADFYDKQKPNIPQIADAYGKALGYPDRNKS